VVNRRQSVRRLLILPPIRVSVGDFSQELLFDLSEGGLSVYGRLASLGRRSFPIKFRLPGDENPITTRGEIAWTARNRTGVRFVNLPDASRFHLKYWMTTKLPAAAPYVGDYRSDWTDRVLHFSRTMPQGAWRPTYVVKAAVVLGILLTLSFVGLELSHSRSKSARNEPTGSDTTLAPTNMPALSGQVLAAQPPGTPDVAPKAAPPDASSPATSNAGRARGFVIQVGALKSERNTDDLSNSLRQKGLPVMVSWSAADALYRVFVGPYPDISSAMRIRNQLKARDVEGFVKPWRHE
jgi:SPOR domain/PilZ domain